MKKIYLTLGLLLIILLSLIIMSLLGYKFNKEFITFDKQQCIEKELPTYSGHSGIEGCIFWMRSDELEKKQNWRGQFKRDDEYCDNNFRKNENIFDNSDASLMEWDDPKCEYQAFKRAKIKENWDLLVSKDKDGYYNYCAEQACPNQPLFK